MTYHRVIPRDLFNESGLLKNLGRLVILLQETNGHYAELGEGNGSPFNIVQDESSGDISVSNLPFTIAGRPYLLSRPLNSRQAWPLKLDAPDYSIDSINLFDEDGNFTAEFLSLIQTPQH